VILLILSDSMDSEWFYWFWVILWILRDSMDSTWFHWFYHDSNAAESAFSPLSIYAFTFLELSIQGWSEGAEMEKKHSRSTIKVFQCFLFNWIYFI
jgi:hypothetical protein